jgi:hypothetical protein
MATGDARIASIYRYPVKGLSPENLIEAVLHPGETIPFDRAYAIENGPGRFDPDQPRCLPKVNFLMLMRNERLATFESRFEPETETLTIYRAGKQVARGQLSSKLGRQMIEQFLAAYMKAELRGAPRIVQAPGHSFSDVDQKCLHIINLASVAELERQVGKPVYPLRFRANVYLRGLPAFEELRWVGQRIRLGDAELDVFARTQRCEATNVDPVTGARDMAIPQALSRSYGHTDMGIYASVARGSTIRPGDAAGLL